MLAGIPTSVPVEYIGLRPGEKLHESLFYDDEQTQATRHPKVLRVRTDPSSARQDVLAIIDELAQVGIRGDHDRARQVLFDTLRRLEASPRDRGRDRMSDEPIPFHRAEIGLDERTAVLRVLESGWLTTGPEVAAFEEEFAAVVGSPHAVALASATAHCRIAVRGAGSRAR